MARKQMFAEGTRNHILKVATRLFFEKGFDGVSVRGLMKQVGADPGGFYYYFESKEALWEEVLQAFFAPYLKEADRLAEEAQERPYRALTRFFFYLQDCTQSFRRELGDRIYPAARLSIRERTLLLLEPYLERILKSIIAHGAQPMMELPLLTVFLAHGIGSVILHQPSEWMKSCGQELQDTVCRLLGLTEASVREMHRLSGFDPARFPLEEA